MAESTPTYVIGDKVKVVNYGHNIWEDRNGKIVTFDIAPQIVGKEGIIAKVEVTQGTPTYAIDGINGKSAWYEEGQLEMITANPNRK